MINVLFFSIAGTKHRDDIDEILLDLQSKDYILDKDKNSIKYTLETSAQGSYPSIEYYQDFYNDTQRIKSISELKNYVLKLKDFYHKEAIVREMMKSINEVNTTKELTERLGYLAEQNEESDLDDLDNYGPKSYSDMGGRPENAGFTLGVSEVDQCTNVFQPGTVASVCAFTSQGKSTMWVSAIYRNIKQGKGGALFSLEVHPDIVWMQFFSRFLYEEKGIEVRAQELIERSLTDERAKQIEQYEDEFKEQMKNLLILDESSFSKKLLLNVRLLTSFIRRLESRIECMDFCVFDHIGQLELLYPDCGNSIIRSITSTCKTYKNSKGLPFFCGFAVQANRDGYKRASKRDGVYDIAAISDLNETERSSSYLVFLYTSDDMKMQQETKITMAKNRLGQLLVEPVVTTFNPAVCVVGDIAETIEYNDDFTDIGKADFSSFEDDF